MALQNRLEQKRFQRSAELSQREIRLAEFGGEAARVAEKEVVIAIIEVIKSLYERRFDNATDSAHFITYRTGLH